MLLKIAIYLCALIVGVFSQCNDKIHVAGANVTLDGVYVKTLQTCDNRDVFYHSDNNTYLYHIGGDEGYWMFRVEYNCSNNDTGDGLVRVKSAEVDPGAIGSDWEEYIGTKWSPTSEIEVICYEIPACRYQLLGADNDNVNGYYDVLDNGNTECNSRDVYKHESQEAYLYFVNSKSENSYYWVVSNRTCTDVVSTTAFLRNKDYTASPLQIENTWEENINGKFQQNGNITLDCVANEGDSGLSAGAIAGIAVGCTAAVGGIAGGLGYYFSKRN